MSQTQVIQFLKKNKRKWFTSRAIAENLKASQNRITENLRKLLKFKFVKRKLIMRKPYKRLVPVYSLI